MKMQRLARFLLWQGFAVFILGLFVMIVACGRSMAESGLGAPSSDSGSSGAIISRLLIMLGLLMVFSGATLKAITTYASEWEEDEDI